MHKHVAYSGIELKQIREKCKRRPDVHLAVELLYALAGRAQDVANLRWSAFSEIRSGPHRGKATVHLKALKTTERTVVIDAATFKLVDGYRTSRKITGWPDVAIFDAPNSKAFRMRLTRFFQSSGIGHVQSHDFRKTSLTDLYQETYDIVKVKNFAGHADIRTTNIYIEQDNETMLNEYADILDARSNKR